MTPKTLSFVISTLALTACYSDPKILNDQVRPMIIPAAPYSTAAEYDQSGIPPMVGIAGSVLTRGQMPLPASGVSVSLFLVERTGSQKRVAELTTGPDGRFEFSRQLKKGDYVIKVEGRRFAGEKTLHNVNQPIRDVIVEVDEKVRSAN